MSCPLLPVLLSTDLIFVPAATSVRAALSPVSNCDTFTASVGLSPAATLVILLPPLFKPSLVSITGLLPLVMVMPPLFTSVSPVFRLPVSPKLRSLFNLTVKVLSDALPTTPILPSVRSLALAALPLTFTVSPKLGETVSPVSPANCNGLLPPAFRVLLSTLNVKSLPACSILTPLPAFRSTLSPLVTNASAAFVAVEEVTTQPELLIASDTCLLSQ